MQVKLCDPCLSALRVCVRTKMTLYKYSSFPFLPTPSDRLKWLSQPRFHLSHQSINGLSTNHNVTLIFKNSAISILVHNLRIHKFHATRIAFPCYPANKQTDRQTAVKTEPHARNSGGKKPIWHSRITSFETLTSIRLLCLYFQ